MKFIKINPPGTWCTNKAFLEIIPPLSRIQSFIEIGPGEGDVSNLLCESGLYGYGIEFSGKIHERLTQTMKNHISAKRYSIIKTDFMKDEFDFRADLIFSIMVMEHIENDKLFINKMKRLLKPGGNLVVIVPGRKNKWGIEDEISRHFRRYDRGDLLNIFHCEGIDNTVVWSLNVPISNILFFVSNIVLKYSWAIKKKELSKNEQTEISGIRNVPFRDVYPSFFLIFINKYTMCPFIFVQRFFYNSNLGTVLIAKGEVKE